MPWQSCDDGFQEMLRRMGDLVDRSVERLLVGSGRLSIATDLADELERGGPDLLVANNLVTVA